MSLSACLDQFLDNLASWSLFGLDNSDRIRKNMPVGFRLGSGAARNQAWPATLNVRGALSGLGQVDCSFFMPDVV